MIFLFLFYTRIILTKRTIDLNRSKRYSLVVLGSVEWSPQKVSLAKYRSNFAGLEVCIFPPQKAVSDSRILKTKEIGEKASRARKNMPCLRVSQSLALTIRHRSLALVQNKHKPCMAGESDSDMVLK